MAVNTATEKGKEIGWEAAEKLLSKTVKEAVKYIFKANGIPAALGGPMEAYYTQQGKIMLKLLQTELTYSPHWSKLAELRYPLVEAKKEVVAILAVTNPTEVHAPGLVALFAALMDPKVKDQVNKWYKIFNARGQEVLNLLDGLILGNSQLLDLTLERITEVDRVLGVTKPRNNFDRVVGVGSVVVARDNLSGAAQELFEITDRLVETRNQWAEKLHVPQAKRIRLGVLEDTCQMIK